MQLEDIHTNNTTTEQTNLSSPSSEQEVKKPFDRKEHLANIRIKASVANKARKGKANFRQKKALKIITENPGITKQEALLKAGYSIHTAKTPSKVFNQEIFQCLLDDIPDASLTNRLKEIALDDDKRASLGALDMIFKLKDRYPQNKLRIDMFKEELGNLME